MKTALILSHPQEPTIIKKEQGCEISERVIASAPGDSSRQAFKLTVGDNSEFIFCIAQEGYRPYELAVLMSVYKFEGEAVIEEIELYEMLAVDRSVVIGGDIWRITKIGQGYFRAKYGSQSRYFSSLTGQQLSEKEKTDLLKDDPDSMIGVLEGRYLERASS